MPGCSICNHAQRKQIEESTVQIGQRLTATKFGVTQSAISRHGQHRVSRQMGASTPAELLAHLGTLLEKAVGPSNPEISRDIQQCIGLLSKALKNPGSDSAKSVESIEQQMARLMSEATNGFDPAEIGRFREMVC